MRRSKDDSIEIPGGDSFLDVTANIVGILVLLTVVVGVRAGRVVTDTAPAPSVAAPDPAETADDLLRDALATREEAVELTEQSALVNVESRLRNQAREELATYNAMLRAELEEEREKLSGEDRGTLALRSELALAEQELDRIMQQQIALDSATGEPAVETIPFDTAPIAGAKVRDEVLVQLRGKAVAFVPHSELLEQTKSQVDAILGSLARASGDEARIERVAGPVNGFVMRSTFEKRRVRTPRGEGIRSGWVESVIEPLAEVVTESVPDAVRPNSLLLAHLSEIDRSATVVTVVAYPDSFGELVDLKRGLEERGFRVATRPMGQHVPIAFSQAGRQTRL